MRINCLLASSKDTTRLSQNHKRINSKRPALMDRLFLTTSTIRFTYHFYNKKICFQNLTTPPTLNLSRRTPETSPQGPQIQPRSALKHQSVPPTKLVYLIHFYYYFFSYERDMDMSEASSSTAFNREVCTTNSHHSVNHRKGVQHSLATQTTTQTKRAS